METLTAVCTGPAGKPTASATAILPFNPTGKPIPDAMAGSRPFAFMWGISAGTPVRTSLFAFPAYYPATMVANERLLQTSRVLGVFAAFGL